MAMTAQRGGAFADSTHRRPFKQHLKSAGQLDKRNVIESDDQVPPTHTGRGTFSGGSTGKIALANTISMEDQLCSIPVHERKRKPSGGYSAKEGFFERN